MGNIDKRKLMDAIIASSGGKIDSGTLNRAAESGDTAALMGAMSEEDRKKLSAALSDKKSLEATLNSEQAKAILKAFLKGGKN